MREKRKKRESKEKREREYWGVNQIVASTRKFAKKTTNQTEKQKLNLTRSDV